MKKISGRVNLDQQLNKYFKVGFSTTYTQQKDNNIPLGSGQNENSGVLRAAIAFNPTIPVRNENGSYAIDVNHSFLPNPVSLLEIDDITTTNRFLGMAYLEFSPIKELAFKVNWGADINHARRNTYLPKTTMYGAIENGKASISLAEKNDNLFDATVNYKNIFAHKHNISLMGGFSYQQFNTTGFNASNSNFLMDSFLWYSLGSGQAEKPIVGSYGGKDMIASFFGRVNYIFDTKYLITTTLRADGASNFAVNKKWGYFPSLAAGWIITNEKFMQPLTTTLSNLKLRFGYGETGNNAIGHRAIAAYRTGTTFMFNNLNATGVSVSILENPNLTWETNTELNLGLDFGLWNNKINGTMDIYQRTITGLLTNKSLLSYHEVNTVAYNAGSTQTKGLDLGLNANLIRNTNFVWDINYNFSLYRDNWKERYPEWSPNIYNTVDEPIRPIYTYLSDGLVQADEIVPHMPNVVPGTIKLKDINGFLRDSDGNPIVDDNGRFQYSGKPDGKLDDADKVLIGRQEPGCMMSLNNTFTYKNFDLNIYFYAYFDRYKIDETREYYEMGAYRINQGGNAFKTIKNAWRSDNQSSNIPSVMQGLSTWGAGDFYYENASFIRLQNITLGYNLPPSFLSKMNVLAVRFYLDVQNLLIFTPYKGLDPETDSMAGYPNQRTFTMGLSIFF